MSNGMRPTLCWDCAKATGGCDWSSSQQPIVGWEAIKTHKKNEFDSYLVYSCPEFERDACNGGLYKYRGEENEKKGISL